MCWTVRLGTLFIIQELEAGAKGFRFFVLAKYLVNT